MIAYRIKYQTRSMRLHEWTRWQDKESVILTDDDTLHAIDELKIQYKELGGEMRITGMEEIVKVNIIARKK